MKNAKFKEIRSNSRGISPLIATLLLIAIAVAASVMTYTWLTSMVGYQSQQAQTQVRIDSLTWGLDGQNCTVVVRNTGSVSAILESVTIRRSSTGSTAYLQSFSGSGSSIDAGLTNSFVWKQSNSSAPANFLTASTEYVIRVTTTTGFQNELTTTTPPS